MNDFFAQVEQELRAATARRAHLPWYRRALASRSAGSSMRVRVLVIAVVFVFASAAIGLAAGGVILAGSPVRPVNPPSPTSGEGAPALGGTRLLPLSAADPAGGLPWGMRIVHTTRGLICVQVGRLDHGQLGQLGIDGAFGNDGRFHALPADALPDVLSNFEGWNFENCAAPGSTYAGDIVGLEASAASNPRAGIGPAADRREISFGLLGAHATSITYRSGTELRTQAVLPGTGAYLIVAPYTSGRQLGSVSETDGSDQPYPYSQPVSPNGALTAISFRYGRRVCTDNGRNQVLRACGLSETPAPRPAALASVHVPMQVHMQIRGDVVEGAELSFAAPYAVTDASQDYSVSVRTCHGLAGTGWSSDVARGGSVQIPLGGLLSYSCSRSIDAEVDYTRFAGGIPESTPVGKVTVRLPPGTHAAPLRRRG